jgi:ribosomal protein S18 acetylase RimI-like enzyme
VELEFRQCKENDITALVLLSKSTFTKAFEKDNDPDDFENYIKIAFSRDTLLKQLRNQNSFFYFVYFNELLLGYLKLNQYQAQTELKTDDSMELERIYILEEFQGQGYGTLVLQKLKDIGLQRNRRFIWLGVWEKNVNAIRFYQRHGFVNFGTHPYYIGTDKQTDWLMKCDLIKEIE